MSKLVITQANLGDLPFILSLAEKEGWNPGRSDAKPFYAADPHGFFIGSLNEEKIGCISAVSYSNAFGFLGLYIVLPECRGKGYGLELWNRAINYFGNRSIGLDGVIAQQDNYKKSGFELYYRNIRFEGKGSKNDSISLTPLDQIPFGKLLAYDTTIFGVKREPFLKEWIAMPNSKLLGKMINGSLKGYGVIRSCIAGQKIGPLFADNDEIAEEIYAGLCATAAGENIYLDVPEINGGALKIAEKYQLAKVFETARMYSSPPPKQELKKTFGITTFELG